MFFRQWFTQLLIFLKKPRIRESKTSMYRREYAHLSDHWIVLRPFFKKIQLLIKMHLFFCIYYPAYLPRPDFLPGYPLGYSPGLVICPVIRPVIHPVIHSVIHPVICLVIRRLSIWLSVQLFDASQSD